MFESLSPIFFRDAEILPYDFNRVVLKPDQVSSNDYINASNIR